MNYFVKKKLKKTITWLLSMIMLSLFFGIVQFYMFALFLIGSIGFLLSFWYNSSVLGEAAVIALLAGIVVYSTLNNYEELSNAADQWVERKWGK